jgi:hypothetical protein
MNVVEAFGIACGFILGVLVIQYITEFVKRKKK